MNETLAEERGSFRYNGLEVKMKRRLLSALLRDSKVEVLTKAVPRVWVSGIEHDSRNIKKGFLFLAQKGLSVDGHDFIQAAVNNGAAAVIGERNPKEIQSTVPYVQIKSDIDSFSYLSASFYGFPARKLTVIGITGTDGKTTTSNLLFSILKAAGIKAGMVTTVNALIGDEVVDTGFHVTTPEANDVQRYMAQMDEAGLTHVILESTSHGLAQGRVTACEYDIAVVTNITHEHLDYHGNYENYRAAKARLFELCAKTPKKRGVKKLGVLNHDDRSFEFLDNFVTIQKVSYGTGQGSDVRASNVQYFPGGLKFVVNRGNEKFSIDSPLVGDFNVSNILAAVTAARVGLDIQVPLIQAGISSLQAVTGRMEPIDLGQNFTAIVDFAHTPNALEVALNAVRKMTKGKVIAVFGSAGLRDREKRRLMAEVSAKLADITVITAEDPRTESLAAILDEMGNAAESKGAVEGETYIKVADRGEAIKAAIKLAKPGDLVVACGKGHEQSMCFGTTEYLWDDRTAMKAALADHLGLSGYPMPYLPTQDKE